MLTVRGYAVLPVVPPLARTASTILAGESQIRIPPVSRLQGHRTPLTWITPISISSGISKSAKLASRFQLILVGFFRKPKSRKQAREPRNCGPSHRQALTRATCSDHLVFRFPRVFTADSSLRFLGKMDIFFNRPGFHAFTGFRGCSSD